MPHTIKYTSSFFPRDARVPLLNQTIGDALRTAAKQYGEKTALIDGQKDAHARRSWTYNSLLESALNVASALQTHFTQGQRIAMWGSNSPEWELIELGASLAGLVLVAVNPAYLADELKYVLKQSKANGIIVQDEYRGKNLAEALESIRSDLPDLNKVILLSQLKEFLSTPSSASLPLVYPDDMAQIQYTSGTTGSPKGACLAHRGLANNGRFFANAIEADQQDIWINPMPMFHTAGCGLATLGSLQTGGTHVMVPEFNAEHVLNLFEQQKGTVMLCVPTMLIRIIEEQERNARNLTSWRLVALGGAPVSPDLIRKARDILDVEVTIGFGQTEASPYLTHTKVHDPNPTWYETVGCPLPHTDMKVISPATQEIVPVGTQGEICGRGYGLMLGYNEAPEATQETIDAEGWLHTGDIGSMDEHGYFRIQGRLKDMIIRGGENIYPREIEDILFTHNAIANVAVIGLSDEEWGETVAACVILKAGKSALPMELESFCRDHLASFKVPRKWYFLENFPQTASGKIQKFVLRDQILNASDTRALS